MVNGASNTAEGTGSWSVAGQGYRNSSNSLQSEHAEWTVSGGEATATTGNPPDGPRFTVEIDASAGTLSIKKLHAQLRQANGISGTVQQTVGGVPRTPTPLTGTASEWGFPVAKGLSTSTTLSGSTQHTLMQPWGVQQVGNVTNETCSWMFADGSTPPPPPPANSPLPAAAFTWVNTVVSTPATNWPTATSQVGSSPVAGGGAQTNWTGNGNLLTATYPGQLSQNHWVAAGKDHWYADPATITAYAIALADPLNKWEVAVFSKTSAPSPTPMMQAELPTGSGYVLTGGGCLLTPPQGAPPSHLLTASFPASDTTWECRGKDHAIASPPTLPGRIPPLPDRSPGAVSIDRSQFDRRSTATITSYVIGVRPKPGSGLAPPMVTITSNTSAPASHPEASVAGVLGWTVTGGGAMALTTDPNGAGQLVTATRPIMAAGSNRPTGWYAKSKDHGLPSPGTVQVYVVSVKFY